MLRRRPSALDGGVALLPARLLLPVPHPVLAMNTYIETPPMERWMWDRIWPTYDLWLAAHRTAPPVLRAIYLKRLTISTFLPDSVLPEDFDGA